MGATIETHLWATKDPLRKAIVEVLDYEDGDVEEYAALICRMIKLLPPEQVPRTQDPREYGFEK